MSYLKEVKNKKTSLETNEKEMGPRSKSHMTLSPKEEFKIRDDFKIAVNSSKVSLLNHLPSID